MSSPSRRLSELGISAKKSLGQHFLHDPAIVERICATAEIHQDTVVVEIGPGFGVLTTALARRAASVIAIEKDTELAEALARSIPGNVDLVQLDALDFNPETISAPDYILVANLPYNVATAILRRFLDSTTPPRSCTFMVQREVAERIVARPPAMNILAVAMQYHGRPRIAFHVGRGAFTPPPHVSSSVVHMPVDRNHDLPYELLEQFFRIVRAGFSARRKQLRNSLLNGGLSRSTVDQMLTMSQIDPKVRPQELDVDDWVRMFNTIEWSSDSFVSGQ